MTAVNKEMQAAKKYLFVKMAVLFLLTAGCGSMLSRPVPSETEYIARYMEYFDGSQIEKLDYVYQGAVGGEFTVARAQFKGPIKIRESMVETRAKDGSVVIGTYDPAKMAEENAWAFKHEWTIVTDGKMPAWLDFPFDRKLRTVREFSEGSDRDARPRYEYKWFIDDERNVVYFRGSKG